MEQQMKITRKATFRNKKTGQIKEFYPGDELGPGWDLIVMPKDRVIYINRSCSGIFESRKELIEP